MVEITGAYVPGLQARPVAVMGALRSGTNYLTYLMERNYRCRVREDIYGWKHSIIPPRSLSHGRKLYLAPVVAIAKNPPDFLQSLYRYYRTIGRNMVAGAEWESFVTGKFVIFDADIMRSPQMQFPNPIAYWNWLYGNLLNLPPAKFRRAHVALDRLMAAPETECDRIAGEIYLKRRRGSFVQPLERLGRRNTSAAAKSTFASAVTLEMEAEAPKVEFSEELAGYVKHWVDRDVLSAFNFTLDGCWA